MKSTALALLGLVFVSSAAYAHGHAGATVDVEPGLYVGRTGASSFAHEDYACRKWLEREGADGQCWLRLSYVKVEPWTVDNFDRDDYVVRVDTSYQSFSRPGHYPTKVEFGEGRDTYTKVRDVVQTSRAGYYPYVFIRIDSESRKPKSFELQDAPYDQNRIDCSRVCEGLTRVQDDGRQVGKPR